MLNLLQELFRALGRFIGFHLSRLFGLRPAPPAAVAPAQALPASIAARLDDAYLQPVAWPMYRAAEPPAALAADPLYQLWRTTSGGHKWSQYFAAYEAVFAQRRTAPLRVLEIGVYYGSSLQLWRRYFAHPGTLIVGIDIREECIRYDDPAAGIRVRIGSQDDGEFLARLVAEFGPFDLIIDDGSHHSSHQIASFNHLFGPGLAEDGIYLVEDLHASYWLPWRDSELSFIDLAKQLVDRLHDHYRLTSHRTHFPDQAQPDLRSAIEVPLITTLIDEVRFFDSIIAIHRKRRDHVPHYLKMLP